MKQFIEKQSEKAEEAFDSVNAQSRNIIIQAVGFIDNLILESTGEQVDQRAHFIKGLFSLRGFLNQYSKQQDAAIVRFDALGSLIDKFDKEEEIKRQLEAGENPQERNFGEHPVSLKDVRNIKSEMKSSQEFHGQEEVVEVEDI
jgi:hypothetical protein